MRSFLVIGSTTKSDVDVLLYGLELEGWGMTTATSFIPAESDTFILQVDADLLGSANLNVDSFTMTPGSGLEAEAVTADASRWLTPIRRKISGRIVVTLNEGSDGSMRGRIRIASEAKGVVAPSAHAPAPLSFAQMLLVADSNLVGRAVIPLRDLTVSFVE